MLAILILIYASPSQTSSERRMKSDGCGQDPPALNALVDEADREEFNTRRVEIAGSTYTRDRDFRRRMVPGLTEGDIFTRSSLEQSIRRISRMKAIYPISMENVEVRLDRRHKVIDIVFCVTQKPRINR